MKKVALVLLLAVFVPSLLLACLAIRSLRDQQFILERQRSLLYQGVADALAHDADNYLADRQHEFGQRVEALLASPSLRNNTCLFDDRVRTNWPLADVGFVVSLDGQIISPLPSSRPAARLFYADYSRFLANRESAEVFWNNANYNMNGNADSQTAQPAENAPPPPNGAPVLDGQVQLAQAQQQPNMNGGFATDNNGSSFKKSAGKQMLRNVMPQQQGASLPPGGDNLAQYSKIASSEAEFRQLIGDSREGTVARLLENKLNVLFWYRAPSEPQLVFGTQVNLGQLEEDLKQIVQQLDPALKDEVVAVLLDDTARPVALSRARFQAPWKHPFVATEIGEALPHWEMAIYLANPDQFKQSAQTLRLTLGSLIALLLVAIGLGGWLIVADLNRQLTLARQKTDFVSNVSHELKTPLTSIRMFSELLAEGRVSEPAKQRTYLGIITAETARLTRLINNVLDFSRMERGEKKYNMQRCEFVSLVRDTIETYRPHLESNGFRLDCEYPANPIRVNGDCDALAQIVVNLLSNAEKYSGARKEIAVQVSPREGAASEAELRVMDRGPGVPRGSEERIFEQFYRAHDSLSSGIQGSGLGLTLARQIARAHGGDIAYEPRPGGGSCFTLRLAALKEA